VIADPPSLGATHVIVTLVFELTKVVGAAGTLGIEIDKGNTAPLPEADATELPTVLVATTVA
jgi:hypothetical protein